MLTALIAQLIILIVH